MTIKELFEIFNDTYIKLARSNNIYDKKIDDFFKTVGKRAATYLPDVEVGTGGPSGPIDAEDVGYKTIVDPNIENVKQALDKLFYVAPKINYIYTGNSVIESGRTLTTTSFSYSINKDLNLLTSVKIYSLLFPTQIEVLNEMPDKVGTFMLPATQGVTGGNVFYMIVSDGVNVATAGTSITTGYRCFYGTTSFNVEELDSPAQSTTIEQTTLNTFITYKQGLNLAMKYSGVPEHWYFIYPKSWGAARFQFGSLPVSTEVTELTIITPYNTLEYYVCKSIEPLTTTLNINITF